MNIRKRSMKKFCKIVIFILCVLFLGAFFSCEHAHTYDTSTWLCDATAHWYKATCEHDGEKGEFSAHVDDNGDGFCEICAYELYHVHTFADTWAFDSEKHWRYSTCGHDAVKDEGPHNFNTDDVCISCGYEKPFVDERIATSWTLAFENGEEFVQTVPAVLGKEVVLTLVDVAPTTVDFSVDRIRASVTDESGETVSLDDAEFVLTIDESAGKIYLKATVLGVYEITIQTENVSKNFTMLVERPITKEIYVTVDGVQVGVVSSKTGEEVTFAVKTNDNADTSCEIQVVAPTGSMISSQLFALEDTDIVKFIPDIAGRYEITVISTAEKKDENLLPYTFTVMVEEPTVPLEKLKGKYVGYFDYVTATFTPDFDGATTGNVTITDKANASSYGVFTHTTRYGYDENSGEITLAETAVYIIDHSYRKESFALSFKMENEVLVLSYGKNGYTNDYEMKRD